jgi:hypothetical protein
MLKLAVIVVLFLSSAVFAKEPDRAVTYGRSYGSEALPAFDKGYLLFTNKPNGVEVWDPDGKLVFQTEVTSPLTAHVMSMAIDSGGTVAVGVGYSLATQGYAGGIVFLDPSGKQIRFVETNRYVPSHVCFDANHNLWTFGWQRDTERNEMEDSQDYSLFRKYSLDGKQLGAFAQRSLFPRPGLTPGSPQGGLWRLRVSGDRVGALADSGQTSETREWIEVGLDGSLIGHWKIGHDLNYAYAFVSAIGLCRQRSQDHHPQIDCFDPETQAWKTIIDLSITDEKGDPLGILLGADGGSLVFGKGGGNIRLSWIRASAQ